MMMTMMMMIYEQRKGNITWNIKEDSVKSAFGNGPELCPSAFKLISSKTPKF